MSLTVVAALVVLSLVKSARSDVGFDTHDLFVFHVDVPPSAGGRDKAPAFYERTLTELASLPGVTAAAASDRLPVLGGQSARSLAIEGRTAARQVDEPWAAIAVVSEDYFAATRIPVIAGRAFGRADADGGLPVAIVNQEMARRYWGSASAAIGQRVSEVASTSRQWVTIVGVVGDTKTIDVTLPPNPQLYRPLAGRALRSVAFLVRSARAGTILSDIRASMRRVAPDLALYEARTFDEAFGVEMSTNYVLSGMYLAFAMIALSLAAAGLYGVVSYSVSQRTREIGIRVALGATTRDVSHLVMAQGGRLLIVGTVLGALGGAAIARSIRALLYDVSPFDPAIYGIVIGVIVVVMGVATYVPARRAMRVDPIRALRAD
jgi:putative ABC transport system permease protein